MPYPTANAPCSWGVEFGDDPRNPSWTTVLDEARSAGYTGMELGPLGFMPEDPAILGPGLASRGLTLVGGVVFRPFHDPTKWDEVKDAVIRTSAVLSAHGGKRIVLIDSISARRAPTAGRGNEAERMTGTHREAFFERLRASARIAVEDYGLSATIHAHAGGWVEFEDELEDVLGAIDPKLLGVCLDTGHSVYAGFDPVAFFCRYKDRVSYFHFKDVDPAVKARVIADRIGFYDACAQGLFCNLGKGAVDFRAMRQALEKEKYSGWITVEQDCDPQGTTSPVKDAKANLDFLKSVGLA